MRFADCVDELAALLPWPFRRRPAVAEIDLSYKSERTRMATDRFLKSLYEAEEDFGALYADEIAEAYVDAGQRFMNREPTDVVGQGEYLLTMPTAMTLAERP